MNLETKITIYKFTPQLFTLTPNVTCEIGGVKIRQKHLHRIGVYFTDLQYFAYQRFCLSNVILPLKNEEV